MPLSDRQCKNVKPAVKLVKLTDANGLQLWVSPAGSKTWRMAYRFEGKQKSLTVGTYPMISLLDARQKAHDARRILLEGADPATYTGISDRQEQRLFRDVARLWFENLKEEWTENYRIRVWARFENDAIPSLGDKSMRDIKGRDVLAMLRMIEARGSIDTARRTRAIVEQVFMFAMVEEWCENNPASKALLVAMKPPRPVEHMKRLQLTEMPDFFRRLRDYDGDVETRFALAFTIQTWVRTIEARLAQWDDFEDLDGKEPLWRIPAARMKMRHEHLVPLSRQTVALLKELRRFTGKSCFLFPARTKDGVISMTTMLGAMYRMGYHGRATVHGFRGLASTTCNDHGWHRDWVERQLAHVERNQTRDAYNSAQYLAGRREMVQWWCDQLSALGRAESLELDARPIPTGDGA